ncbi:MAG: hypothetical protein RLZZ453_97 [Chlamydiota bacterium]|jgi:hypothetical protein
MELNKLKKAIIGSCLGISALFFFSLLCSFKSLSPTSPLATQVLEPLVQQESRVTVAAEWMSGEESKRAFGHDFPSREVHPLKILIQNNTSSSYSITAGSVDMPRLSASQVAFKVTKSSIPRSIAYKVAGFFFWPLMIPGTIDGIRVFAHHHNLKKEIRAKSFKDQEGEIVTPYSTCTRVLFVEKDDVKPNVKITLIDLSNLEPVELQLTTHKE